METETIINILIIIFGAILIVAASKKFISSILSNLKLGKDEKYDQRLDTLNSLFNNIVSVVVYISAVLMSLNQLGFNITPILTGAGILGLGISFGLQTLVKDIISGILIFSDNTYNIGDHIIVGDFSGKVYQLKIRKTILKDQDGNLIHIPNSEIQKVKVMKRK